MKFLCVADHIDPLVYSLNIKERFKDVDIVIGAGDLPLRYYDFIVSSINKPLLFVFGNHHLKNIHHYKKNLSAPTNKPIHYLPGSGGIYINQKVRKIKNCLVAGLGGSCWYNGDPNQFSEFGMYMKIISLVPRLMWNKLVHGRFLDVLITHAAPLGIGDGEDHCHRGFKSFLWFMRVFKPFFLLHGHIHLYDYNAQRIHHCYETTVINVYDHFILEIENSNHRWVIRESMGRK